eukprot:s2553_g2.t1
MSMSKEVSVSFPGSLLQGKLDITVRKVGPKTKKHLGDQAPKVGDLIEKLHCTGLKKPDGTPFTMSAKEVSLLQRCFRGEIRCYVSARNRNPIGGTSSQPFFPFRPTLRMAEGQITPKMIKRACRGGCASNMGEKIELLPEVLRKACSGKAALGGLLKTSPAILEHMLWHRVILDEFHESEAWAYRVREMLRGLKANFKWGSSCCTLRWGQGLSGTPPMEDAQAVAEVANLLGFANATKAQAQIMATASYWGNSMRRRMNPSQKWFCENQEKLQATWREAAEAFVANHVRQSSSQLIERIGVKEYEVFVDHTSEERLIYRQACHDQGIFDLASGYCEITTEARQELLKRCAHFDLGEAQCSEERADPGSGVLVLIFLLILFFDAVVAASSQGGSHLDRARWLSAAPVQPIPESEYYCDGSRHAVVHAIARHIGDEDADEVLADWQICEQVCPKRNKKGVLVKTPRSWV